jgi:hypothetical protein
MRDREPGDRDTVDLNTEAEIAQRILAGKRLPSEQDDACRLQNTRWHDPRLVERDGVSSSPSSVQDARS